MARRWKKHFLIWLTAVLLVGTGIVLYVPALHWGLIGLVRRESFFHGRPTSYWRLELMNPTSRAAEELAQGRAAAVPVLVEILNGQGRGLRARAAHLLGRIGPPAEAAIPALQEAMEEEDLVIQYAAGAALNRIDPTANLKGWPR